MIRHGILKEEGMKCKEKREFQLSEPKHVLCRSGTGKEADIILFASGGNLEVG